MGLTPPTPRGDWAARRRSPAGGGNPVAELPAPGGGGGSGSGTGGRRVDGSGGGGGGIARRAPSGRSARSSVVFATVADEQLGRFDIHLPSLLPSAPPRLLLFGTIHLSKMKRFLAWVGRVPVLPAFLGGSTTDRWWVDRRVRIRPLPPTLVGEYGPTTGVPAGEPHSGSGMWEPRGSCRSTVWATALPATG